MVELSLESLSTGYRGHIVGQNLSFTVAAGEVTCLLGANGCGKTTLLKTLLGLLPPLAGTVWLGQQRLSDVSAKQLAQWVGYVPQAQSDLFPYTALEMVLMGRTAHVSWLSTPGPKDRAIALDCLRQLGIEHLAQRRYPQLSGGERQLVLIARALAQQPQLLIMDEPTASLDFGNQIRVLAVIERLKAQGLAILLTTHQPEHAHRVADRVVLLHQGQILANGPKEAALSAVHLATLYGLEESLMRDHLAFLTPTF